MRVLCIAKRPFVIGSSKNQPFSLFILKTAEFSDEGSLNVERLTSYCSEYDRAVTHARGGADGRQECCERGY